MKNDEQKLLSANEVLIQKGGSHWYDRVSRENIYEFECLVDGEPSILTYTVGKRELFTSPLYDHGDIEDVFSIHTDHDDIWERMTGTELEKLACILDGEAEVMWLEKEITDAKSIMDLKKVDFDMMEIPSWSMTSEQRKRVWDLMSFRGTKIIRDSLEAAEDKKALQKVCKAFVEAENLISENEYAELKEDIQRKLGEVSSPHWTIG